MPSFNSAARRVRDSSRPHGQRYAYFLRAVQSYAYLTLQHFEEAFTKVGERFGFDRESRLTTDQLLDALNYIERDRNMYLAAFHTFARRRIREKYWGQRQLTQADRERWNTWT
jgi:hypothetical protein